MSTNNYRGRSKRVDLLESFRNAVTGYTTVILAIICFIISLMVVVAITRLIVGISLSGTPQVVSQTTVTQVQGRS